MSDVRASKQEMHALFGDLVTLEIPRDTEGKIRTGLYDRGLTFGKKLKDGIETEFSVETCSQMMANWKRRGEMLALCYNHQSAYVQVNGAPAPALAFYDAMEIGRAHV